MEKNNCEEIKSLDNIEVIFREAGQEGEYNVCYLAEASIGGVTNAILITSCSQDEDGKWYVKYNYQDKERDKCIMENTAPISAEERKKIDDVHADANCRFNVSLIDDKNNRVCKLVTHTCINSTIYTPRNAQKVLIEKSQFNFKVGFYTQYKKNNGLFAKGDYHYINSRMTFSLKQSLPADWSEERLYAEKEWEVKGCDKDGNVVEGRQIVDPASKDLIVKSINNACKSITKQTLKTNELGAEIDEDNDDNQFVLVSFPGYRRNKENDKKSIVYSVERFGQDEYYIETGLFCGQVILGDKLPPLEIRTEYSDTLVKRMIDRCCGIYVDTTPSDSEFFEDNFYSKIVQYMYLLSLRKVISVLVPQKYVYLKDRGYNIKGNIDINAYVNRDIISKDKKVSYIYPERREIQSIIDVMYAALKTCRITQESSLPRLKGYKDYLESIYSGNYPSRSLIKNIDKSKILKTGLYSAFKRPIELAKMLLENNEFSTGGMSDNQGISALLMDSSYLWETYLESIMRDKLGEWNIDAQHTIHYYKNTFYPKENRPDFVLTNSKSGEIFILDAKFKHMAFRGVDVDNSDIQQLHCYSYYYYLTHGSNFRGAALMYPTREDQSVEQKRQGNDKFFAKMFGTDYAEYMKMSDQIFGVLTLKDADKCEENDDYEVACSELEESEKLNFNEDAFISRLESFLEAAHKKESGVV